MNKITFAFATFEKAHVVQNEIRAAGYRTISTSDNLGFYVHTLTSEHNRKEVEAARLKALASLR